MYFLCVRMNLFKTSNILLCLCLAFTIPLPGQDNLDSVLVKVRGQRAQNLQKYYSYKARVLETCKAQVLEVPYDIWPFSGIFIPAKSDSGMAYYSEALILAEYGDPKHYYQKVVLKRESGKLPIPNWQHLPSYDFNLLQQRIYLNEVFDRGFVSPLSEEGAKMYDFKLHPPPKGDSTKLRISFRARKEKFPAMTGFIDLDKNSGLPLHAEFSISANNQLELLDSISVKQNFKLENGIYKAVDQVIELHLNLFNYRGYYQVQQVYQSFRYREFWEKSEFDKLVYEQQKENFNADSTYWDAWERSPLDSAYMSSLEINDNRENQFRSFGSSRLDPGPYIFYKNFYRGYTRRKGQFYWDLPPIYRGLGFNPVEGLYWRGQTLFGYNSGSRELNLRLQGRIGTADQRFKPVAELNWQSNSTFPLNISIEGGTDYKQLNEEEPILPVLNTFFNLALAENYINLYGKDYFKIKYQGESISGLTLGLEAEYAWRYPVFNKTNFNLFNPDASYNFNNLGFAPNINPGGFPSHRSLGLDINLTYQFQDRYELRYKQRFQDVLKGRQNLVVRAPKIYYDLKLGLPYLDAQTDFIFHSLGIQHQFRWGNIGLSQFDISGGQFLRKANVPFVDFRHFDGVQIFFLQPSTDRSALIKQFSTLPYYTYSTTNNYLELHYEHNFDGALLSNINLTRRYKIHSLIGFNSLHIQNEADFIEVFFGFDNIFKILRVEFAGGLDNFQRLRPSLRLGFDFRYDYYKRNRR